MSVSYGPARLHIGVQGNWGKIPPALYLVVVLVTILHQGD